MVFSGPSHSNHTINNKQTYSPDVRLYMCVCVSVPLLVHLFFSLSMTGHVIHAHCIFSICVSPVGGECIN